MNLYENTTELNEVLNMARNLPNANENPNGEAVQEIFYVDFGIDMSQFKVITKSADFADIIAQLQAGKYVVGRGIYATSATSLDNVAFFPLSANVTGQNLLMFSGFIQSLMPDGETIVVLYITLELYSSGAVVLNRKMVNVTTLE